MGILPPYRAPRTHYKWHRKDYCEHCGLKPEYKVVLDVDHIDGDHTNNDPSNLQTLCANCHRIKTVVSGDGVYKRRCA